MAVQGKDPLYGVTIDGRYRVESRLARGGMSTVYLALDQRLHRKVALKVLYPHLAQDPKVVARFEDEAINAAKLSHFHIVNVLDQGVDGEYAYLVMEYVPGKTLRDVLAQHGRLTPRHALQLMDAIVDGLAAAHAAGLVHRDMKPENVLLAPDGRIKVADFGLARAASNHTASSTLVGTVAYISPELVKGEPADARSDIYAIGIMLYELLTGKQPFTADMPINIAFKHVQDAVPPPSEVLPGLARDLDELVEWCTSKDPENRPHDAEALLGELRHIAGELTEKELDYGASEDYTTPLPSGPVTLDHGTDPDEQIHSATEVVPGATEVISPDAAATSVISPGLAETQALATPTNASSGESRRFDDQPATPAEALPAAAAGAALTPRQARKKAKRDHKQWKKDAQVPLESLEKNPRRKGWLWAGLVFLLAALLGTAGWFFGMGPGASVTIPALHGESAEDATARLDELGVAAASSPIYDDDMAAGYVVGTDPEANTTIRRFQGVELLVSRGPELFSVPNLRGLTLDAAESEVAEAQLTLGETTEDYNESVPAGEVVSQDPAPDEELRRGTEIDVVLSAGPAPVDVPDVTGLSAEDAENQLTSLGLTGEVAGEEHSTEVAEGLIIAQSPSSGQVERGGTVSYTVSLGPRMVEVPRVTGRQLEEAKRLLEEAGFVVEVTEGTFGIIFNTVATQDPGRGELLPEGSTVTIGVV
ncbi:Stk1 family PASTA domain-containing Ser/Thr kinase [Zhihengliuella flava]|uniref:non-specific serine/threonine protein kinase n=1 Tax=Zhihengliuella flava TaxID=1285193 RepID=A0A931D783_9MICC|nr:serine/threonine-protein kinase [Zhihengliuella flava]